ncbi:heterotrimeric G protein alpha subunit [Neolentinus lepideus HHB14362 ss-1]|uniref:Guanine nucleotide-binding protein subunit alpha n=1 Tax=Neolentinus lepideus HHB14362 ss-1 TaxID=1314782 RepID=A0A165TU57_9AGAM|nr:heterotrimeric G protein alpha subunit [Neolentinus lepideus HHB14362 ss-1]
MGICVSSPEEAAARARSDEIDHGLELDAKRLKRECKILLLGAGESGKSTIVKQMKIIHQDGFTKDELDAYRCTVYQNLLDSAQAVVLALRKFGMDCEVMQNRANTDRILDYKIENSPAFFFSDDIAQAVHDLWRDPVIPKLMEHSSDFYLMDNASYFFDSAPRIGSPTYLPTEADVLRVREKSTGVKETRFSIGALSIHMFDVGGQRSERRKWIHCFESVTSIIFCTALSEYDQVLLEESKQNRMEESLVLFESVINSRWFLRTSIILFLNKIDVFKAKIPKVPLAKYCPEYAGGSDLNKATKYILWKFMQANRAGLSVYPHVTQATDTYNIQRVFAAVKETILQLALKDSGIL